MLFLETKQELVDSVLSEKTKKDILVKTRAYRQVRNQSAFILVGRKGSGKTTITKQMTLQDEANQFIAIEIYVDNFNLEFMYEYMIQPQLFSEIRALHPQLKLFRSAWKIFIFTSAIIAVTHKFMQSSPRLKGLENVEAFCRDALGQSVDDLEKIDFWSIFGDLYTSLTQSQK